MINASAVDASGNIYVVGSFVGTIDFDPGPGNVSAGPSFGTDIWFGKYSSTGSLIWARALIGGSDDVGDDIVLDNAGNIYITGNFGPGTLDFDPGPGSKNLSPSSGMYFAKYTNNGNLSFAFSVNSTTGYDAFGRGIAVDGNGGLYVAGSIIAGSTVDFDPSSNVFNLNGNNGTIYIAKYSSVTGGLLSAKNINNPGAGGTAYDIKVDGTNSPYITGIFSGATDFNPDGTGISFNSTAGSAFVAKYNSSISLQWAFNVTGQSNDLSFAVATDAAGNAYVTGSFNVNGYDIFLAKFSSTGQVWRNRIGGSNIDMGNSITFDQGNVYVSGSFTGDGTSGINFNPNGSIQKILSLPNGRQDFFLGKYNATSGSADNLWVQNLDLVLQGSDNSASAVRVINGKVVLAGTYKGTGDFNPCLQGTAKTAPVPYGFFASYNATDPTPNVTGPATDCATGGTYTYTLNNYTGASSVTWSVTPANLFQSATQGTGPSCTLQVNASVNGQATLTFVENGACGTGLSGTYPLSFWVGNPIVSSITIDGNTQPYPLCSSGTNITYTANQDHIIEIVVAGGDAPIFTLNDPSGLVSTSLLSPGRLDFISKSTSPNFSISYSSTNVCGTTTQCLYFSNSGPCIIPGFTSVTINGSPAPIDCSTIIPFSANVDYTIVAATNGSLPVTFTLNDPNHEVTGTVLSNFSYKVRANATTYSFIVTLNTSDLCGSAYRCLYFCTGPSCQGSGPVQGGATTLSSNMVSVYPNPVTSMLTVQITDSSSTGTDYLDQPYLLYLIDRFSQRVLTVQSSEKTIQIPTDGLPQDIYYLVMIYKEATLRKQVIIKR